MRHSKWLSLACVPLVFVAATAQQPRTFKTRLGPGDERDGEWRRRKARGERLQRAFHRRFSCGISQPHKLPSGAFSL